MVECMIKIVKIVCPVCGCVLSVKDEIDLERKFVTCPACRHKLPFTAFRRVLETNGYMPSMGNMDPNTQIAATNYTLGRLKAPKLDMTFQLQPGRNVIGRKSPESAATIQIPCEKSRRMSREHLVIEAKKVPAKGFVHYVSLFKERENATYIGRARLEYGDCLVLSHGDIIKLPDMDLIFEIPNEETTDI